MNKNTNVQSTIDKIDKIHVNASSPYDIFIGKGILKNSGTIVRKLNKGENAVIITDDNVDKLYSQVVLDSLKDAGYKVSKFVFPHGEPSKSHKVLMPIYEFLAEHSVTRSDVLIGLGGGITGDMTGFAAASYLRGLDFVQIPTTLLAQVDSSVGGKTGIDIAAGKNLVGAFKQPIAVICDINTLSTLSQEIFADGMAEVIKHGMIRSEKLFDMVFKGDFDEKILDVVKQNILIKARVVENDEKEKGERMQLNFGHTLGHAIERYYNYTSITHGQAVAIGMSIFTNLAERQGLCEKGLHEKLCKCLENNKLPIKTNINIEELYEFSLKDKKRLSNGINIILCTNVGKCITKNLEINEYKKFLQI